MCTLCAQFKINMHNFAQTVYFFFNVDKQTE